MAWMNTIFGLQRTLMAAQRTAVTLIAFGFTLAQLFQSLKSQVPPQFLALGPHIPRDVGLLMIAAGIGSLALFTWQYLRAVKYLGDGPFAAISAAPRHPAAPAQLLRILRNHADRCAGIRFGARELLIAVRNVRPSWSEECN